MSDASECEFVSARNSTHPVSASSLKEASTSGAYNLNWSITIPVSEKVTLNLPLCFFIRSRIILFVGR